MRAAMTSVSAAPRSGLYSSACFRHCVTLSSEFWTATATTPYAGQVREHAGPAVVRVRVGERGCKQGMRERACARVDVNDSERVKKTETEEGKKYVYSLM